MQPSRSTFGKYVLLRKLASGGMGEIFLAKQRGPEGFEKLLVIKRILSHHLDKKDYLDMFFSEAKLVARLNHHNIIQIHEMGEIEGDHYIAMEYVRGKSLRDVIDELRAEGRSMPVAHVVDLGIKLCEGLGYAHQARDIRGRPMNIVHRDINPHNILISYTGDLKLIDFGIAKSEMTSVHTATGTIKGKFVYMSPEQSAADPLDKRSDIFSLGIVLYEMLALENPFVRQNVVLSLEAIQRQPVPPPSERRPEAAALDEVLLRALEKSPEGRFQSAIEMRDALRALSRSGAIPQPETDLSSFLHSLFTGDIAEEDRLLAEADRAARALPPPSVAPASLVGSDTDELVDAPMGASDWHPSEPPTTADPGVQAPPSAFLDEEPTIAGDPSDLAQRSLEVSQQIRANPAHAPARSSEVFAPASTSEGTDELLRSAPPGSTSSAVAAAGVVGTGPHAQYHSGRAVPEPAFAPPESSPPAPITGSRDIARVVLYGLVFVLTIALGFVGTRMLIGSAGSSTAPIEAEAPLEPAPSEPDAVVVAAVEPPPEAPPPEAPPIGVPPVEPPAVDTVAAPAPTPALEPSAPTPAPVVKADPEPVKAPPKKRRSRRRRPRRRRPRAAAPKPAPKPSPEPAPVRAAVTPAQPKPVQAAVQGRLRISTSTPLSVVADGKSLGRAPASYVARRERGKIVLSGGREVDYAITLSYEVTPRGLEVSIASSPWAIVKHGGLSLGRTPRGPVGPARRHVFSLLRPGQSTPLAVTLTWSPP